MKFFETGPQIFVFSVSFHGKYLLISHQLQALQNLIVFYQSASMREPALSFSVLGFCSGKEKTLNSRAPNLILTLLKITTKKKIKFAKQGKIVNIINLVHISATVCEI